MVCAFNFSNDIEPTSSIPKIGFDGVIGWLVKGKLVSRLMNNMENSSTIEVKNDLSGEDEFFEIGLPITKETESLDDASPKNIEKLEEIGRKYVAENSEQIQRLCDTLVKYVEVETHAMTHEQVAEDIGVAIEVSSELEHSSDNDAMINKEVVEVPMVKRDAYITGNNADKSDNDAIASNSIITNDNREQILDGIKQHLTSFANDNPDLKANIDQYLVAVNDYSNQELEKLILDFAEGQRVVEEMELYETESVLAPYMSCSMEASQEAMELEGIDDEVQSHEVLA